MPYIQASDLRKKNKFLWIILVIILLLIFVVFPILRSAYCYNNPDNCQIYYNVYRPTYY